MNENLIIMIEKQKISEEYPLKKGKKKFYIFYTYAGAEMDAYLDLRLRGYEVWMPLQEELCESIGRKIDVDDVPVIPGYIFVFTNTEEITCIEETQFISGCVRTGLEPDVLSTDDALLLGKMVALCNNVSAHKIFRSDDRVRIISGPLNGHEGLLIMHPGKLRFGLYIGSLNYFLSIEIGENNFIRIPEQESITFQNPK